MIIDNYLNRNLNNLRSDITFSSLIPNWNDLFQPQVSILADLKYCDVKA